MTKQFLKIIQEDPEITKYFKDAVCKAFCHIYESAATDVNQMQIAADPGSVAPGIENEEQVATSNDLIVNELLQNSAAAKGGCRVSLSSPGRTSLGIMGGNVATNGLSCGTKGSGAGGQNVCADCTSSN